METKRASHKGEITSTERIVVTTARRVAGRLCGVGASATLALLVVFSPACKPKVATESEAAKAFTDDFNRTTLGPKYKKAGGTWSIENGALHSSGEKNIPLWLDHSLGKNVRVEFTAWSNSTAVDTKVEIFGDGLRHESGYIVIFGGWNNKISTIARLDEHEKTRIEKRTKWKMGQKYKWTIERTDGKTVVWKIDGVEVLRYADKDPLVGPRNDRLGFTNWQSDVYYDDLKITPL